MPMPGTSLINDLLLLIHEPIDQFDGNGYPAGLKGNEIPVPARIVALANSYHSMVSNMVYGPGTPPQKAQEELVKGAGKQWDSDIIDAFLRCKQRIRAIRQRPISSALRQAIETTLAANNSTPLHGLSNFQVASIRQPRSNTDCAQLLQIAERSKGAAAYIMDKEVVRPDQFDPAED